MQSVLHSLPSIPTCPPPCFVPLALSPRLRFCCRLIASRSLSPIPSKDSADDTGLVSEGCVLRDHGLLRGLSVLTLLGGQILICPGPKSSLIPLNPDGLIPLNPA
eukprot:9483504-Pyramimonas_sp.AAC.1